MNLPSFNIPTRAAEEAPPGHELRRRYPAIPARVRASLARRRQALVARGAIPGIVRPVEISVPEAEHRLSPLAGGRESAGAASSIRSADARVCL